MRTSALPTLALLTLMVLFRSRADGQAAPEESPAVAAARARQEAVKTLEVEFRCVATVPKGAISDADPKAYGKRAPLPANDLLAESINRLVIDGVKVRYEDNHPTWSNWYAPDGALRKRTTISTSDGTNAKLFFPKGLSGQGNPLGIISRDALAKLMISQEVLSPITMTFRGLDIAFRHHPITLMKPSGNILPIDWEPCQEQVIALSKDVTAHFWLDPCKGYVVRHLEDHLGLTDIRYRRDDDWGWVPEAWVFRTYERNGVLSKTIRVEVLQMRINEPQPAELFEIQFPPGCQVNEQRDGRNREFFVQSDGSLREISPRTGTWLTGPTIQAEGAWYWQYRWLLAGCGVICAGLAWQYTRRRKRRVAA